MRVALVHDWLIGMRGGEYVLEAVAELFPQAEIFTLIAEPSRLSTALRARKIHTSFLQRVPGVERRYRHLLPLMPAAIESFDLTGYDLIVSTSHCVAKGVRKPAGARHVSYVFAPMRYMWDRYDEYFAPGKASLVARAAARGLRPFLQHWDRRSSRGVDEFVTQSHFIADEIRRFYGRESRVVYPFADLSRFGAPREPGAEYLMVGAFAPYKRVDLAIEAFNRLKLPLAIVGSGQDEDKLRAAAGPTVRFLGHAPNDEIARLYARCRAFVFPGREDFGITPLEALAAGAPVIAYRAGGAAETLSDKTAVYFDDQSVEGLCAAVERVERGESLPREADCREHVRFFSRERFQRELREIVRS